MSVLLFMSVCLLLFKTFFLLLNQVKMESESEISGTENGRTDKLSMKF